ncbi:Tetraspanin-11, partial [Fragariocoptes setiger]
IIRSASERQDLTGLRCYFDIGSRNKRFSLSEPKLANAGVAISVWTVIAVVKFIKQSSSQIFNNNQQRRMSRQPQRKQHQHRLQINRLNCNRSNNNSYHENNNNNLSHNFYSDMMYTIDDRNIIVDDGDNADADCDDDDRYKFNMKSNSYHQLLDAPIAPRPFTTPASQWAHLQRTTTQNIARHHNHDHNNYNHHINIASSKLLVPKVPMIMPTSSQPAITQAQRHHYYSNNNNNINNNNNSSNNSFIGQRTMSHHQHPLHSSSSSSKSKSGSARRQRANMANSNATNDVAKANKRATPVLRLGCAGKCAKFFLFVANLLFWLSGAALATWGVIMLVEDHKYNLSQLMVFEPNARMSLFQLLSWSFIALGAISLLVGCFGCAAIAKNSRWIVGLYIFIMLAIFALDLATGLLAMIFQEKLITNVRLKLVGKLKTEYGIHASFTAALDYLQAHFKCCGLEGHYDYEQSLWRLQRLGGHEATVARTCCHLRNDIDDQAHINPRPVNESMCQSADLRFHQSYRYRKVKRSTSFMGALGLTMLLIACIIPGNYWPLMTIIFYAAAPIPLLFLNLDGNQYQNLEPTIDTSRDLAIFVCTGILVSAFAWPLFLLNTNHITGIACFMTEAATLCIYATAGLFASSVLDDEMDQL